jgi:hypothetical protein
LVSGTVPRRVFVDESVKLTVPVAPARLPETVAVKSTSPGLVTLGDDVRITVDGASTVLVTTRTSFADELGRA